MAKHSTYTESNHFCLKCEKDIGSDDHVSKRHRGCGGEVVWHTYKVLVLKRLIMVDRKKVKDSIAELAHSEAT